MYKHSVLPFVFVMLLWRQMWRCISEIQYKHSRIDGKGSSGCITKASIISFYFPTVFYFFSWAFRCHWFLILWSTHDTRASRLWTWLYVADYSPWQPLLLNWPWGTDCFWRNGWGLSTYQSFQDLLSRVFVQIHPVIIEHTILSNQCNFSATINHCVFSEETSSNSSSRHSLHALCLSAPLCSTAVILKHRAVYVFSLFSFKQ